WMSVSCAKRGSSYQVEVATPEPEEIENIQTEIVDLLFSDEPFEQGIDDEAESEPDQIVSP
ncbi:hypothetical protein OAF56_05150, partial [Pirellulaceae bacterium]|nr:hypothetical protein [Pirellulaceae bacterium]